MADKKISQLSDAAALTGGELVELVQGGVNLKTTTQQIADLGGAGTGTVESVTGDGVDNTDPDNPVLTFPVASEVGVTPAGNIESTDVQAALEELDAGITELGDLVVDQITGAVSLVSADLGKLWELSGTTTDYTVDLPTAVGNAEKTVIFKGLSGLTKNVTISGISGQTIDGVTTRVIGGGGSLTLISDGANWQIVNEIGSWVNYTPVWGGFSADPTVGRAAYLRVGKTCTVQVNCTANGTSNATTLTVTLPFPAKFHTPTPAVGVNNGTTVSPFSRIDAVTSSSVANGYLNSGGAAWTASGGKRISFTITYEVE